MRKPIPLPVPFETPPEPDCPRCPPKGAPAWMATFADIATLLMAFFVLILSFAEFNTPKFKMVAGSLERAFGVQREVPVVEQPRGTTVLELNFSPSPEMAVTEEITQDTTDRESPEVRQPTAEDFEDQSPSDAEALAQAVNAALQDALQNITDVAAEARDGEVVVAFSQTAQQALAQQLQAVAEALDSVSDQQGQPAAEVLLDGLTGQIAQLAEGARLQDQAAQEQIAQGQAERSAAMAEAELSVALRQEVAQGLVTIEQQQDRVVVTVGAGGAFPSGTAELTSQARDVMARLALTAMGEASDIVVTGHTDTVPLSPGSPYGDNWGLAAARASAVVRELAGTALIAPDRLTAISRGETRPVADNATSDGRAENRRIEIEITY